MSRKVSDMSLANVLMQSNSLIPSSKQSSSSDTSDNGETDFFDFLEAESLVSTRTIDPKEYLAIGSSTVELDSNKIEDDINIFEEDQFIIKTDAPPNSPEVGDAESASALIARTPENTNPFPSKRSAVLPILAGFTSDSELVQSNRAQPDVRKLAVPSKGSVADVRAQTGFLGGGLIISEQAAKIQLQAEAENKRTQVDPKINPVAVQQSAESNDKSDSATSQKSIQYGGAVAAPLASQQQIKSTASPVQTDSTNPDAKPYFATSAPIHTALQSPPFQLSEPSIIREASERGVIDRLEIGAVTSNRLDTIEGRTTMSSVVASTATAKAAIQQISVAVSQNAPGVTELVLSPEELGRVRMVVSAQDNAISVVISAERPETSDMLRRHIDSLAQEFRNLGFGATNFTFEGGQGDRSGHEGSQNTDVINSTKNDDDSFPVLGSQSPNAGLDLRI